MTDSPEDDADPRLMTAGQGVRITSGSRLHFGLLDTVEPFGGIGVMIDRPATEVVVSASDHFVCEDPEAPRVTAIAGRVASQGKLAELPRCRIAVTQRPPAHCGLGSGTQLAMAAAEALCRFAGLHCSRETLARSIAARGKRSAVGVHGYFLGGLVFEDAGPALALNPLQQRVELPADWCVGIFRPTSGAKGISGDDESEQFARLAPASGEKRAELRDIILSQLLPAAGAGAFAEFSNAVRRYNEVSGRLFEAVQGGPYNGAAVTRVIDWLLEHDVLGVGQSSWGPGVFAWFESITQAQQLAARLPDDVALIAVARSQNSPRKISRHP